MSFEGTKACLVHFANSPLFFFFFLYFYVRPRVDGAEKGQVATTFGLQLVRLGGIAL